MGDFETPGDLLGGFPGNPGDAHFIPCNCPGNAGKACDVLRDARMKPHERKAAYDAELSRATLRREGRGQHIEGPALLSVLQGRCGVPPVVIMALAGKLDVMAKPLAAAQSFLNKPDVCVLLLAGSFGCGKSVAAAHVLKHYARAFEWNSQSTGMTTNPFVWADARELASISEWKESDRARLDTLRSARVLVLDDLGDEGTNPGRDALANLMLHRYSQQRRTVITSNLTLKAFGARYGEAVVDRLRASSITPNLSAEKSRRSRGEAA